MISKDTILSIFNEKGTLLKWLQKLEKAYTGAELTNVEITQVDPLTAIFTFLFEDGSNVKSSPITLPEGPAGKDGVNGTNGVDGAPGKDGNGIVSIVSGEPYISGDKTITPVTIDTDEEALYVTVSAQNGANGANGTNGIDGKNGHISAIGAIIGDTENPEYIIIDALAHSPDVLKVGDTIFIEFDRVNQGNASRANYILPVSIETTFDPLATTKIVPISNVMKSNPVGYLKGERGAQGANGTNGTDGVGIESITTIGYREGTGANVGYTETMLKAHMTDNTDKDLSVFAKAGDTIFTQDVNIVIKKTGVTVVYYDENNNIQTLTNSTQIPAKIMNGIICIKSDATETNYYSLTSPTTQYLGFNLTKGNTIGYGGSKLYDNGEILMLNSHRQGTITININ